MLASVLLVLAPKVIPVAPLLAKPRSVVEAALGPSERESWPPEIGGVAAEARRHRDYRVEYIAGRAKAIERELSLDRAYAWPEALKAVGYDPAQVQVDHRGPTKLLAISSEHWHLSGGSLTDGVRATFEVRRQGDALKWQILRVEAPYRAVLAANSDERKAILGTGQVPTGAAIAVAGDFAFASFPDKTAFALLRRQAGEWKLAEVGSAWKPWAARHGAPAVLFPDAD